MSTAPSTVGLVSPVASWRSVFALAMVSQACLFWWTGSGRWRPNEYPTTFSGLWRNGDFYAGSVSHGGRNSVFVTGEPYAGNDVDFEYESRWSERVDGHFCGFIVHPNGYQPPGFRLYLGWGALSWTCPYWLMTAAWLIAFTKTRGAFRFSLRDALTIMGLTAISLGLIHLQVALVATTLLNLATATLLAWFVLASVTRALLALKPAVAQSPAPE
jgi:hypothetical protein